MSGGDLMEYAFQRSELKSGVLGMDAAAPWLVAMFGGRHSARSVHFIGMAAVVGFVVLHLAMVLVSGPVRRVWAMIVGVRA